jgi:CRP/FNR family transcriptional regulator, cyclic AMP receptor protein
VTAPPAEAIAEVLASVPLLSRLSDRQRSRLARLATTRSYREGAVVVREGDTSMSLYVILTGSVRIERTNEAGESIELEVFGPGGAFGEMGLIDDLPRAATAVALEETLCALLAKWDFQNELRSDPDIALALLPELNARIRALEDLLARPRAAG